MRILTWMLAVLTLAPLPAAAFDPDVSAQLERIASDPKADMDALARGASDAFFMKVRESCKRELQTTQEKCETSRVLRLLDSTGMLLERCSALDRRRGIVCAMRGAVSLRMVAALDGNPSKDIEWQSAYLSYFTLRDALWHAAWLHCKSEGSYGDDCLAKQQAAMLSLPSAAGSFCANHKFDKRGCLDSLLRVAVYLDAIGELDGSRPL